MLSDLPSRGQYDRDREVRAADLLRDHGLSIYRQLFQLVREIEEKAGQPLFQYIVTTTTRPSDDLSRVSWLVLTVRGSPGHELLLAAICERADDPHQHRENSLGQSCRR